MRCLVITLKDLIRHDDARTLTSQLFQVTWKYKHEWDTVANISGKCGHIVVAVMSHYNYENQSPRGTDSTRFAVLRAFVKLRKATINFVMSVCLSVHLSVRMEQLGSHWTYFNNIWYLRFFSKIYRENSSYITIRQKQRIHYADTFSHLWQYLANIYTVKRWVG